MDGNAPSISPTDLYARLGTAKAPLLFDVRRAQAFESDDTLIIGSARRLPEDVAGWGKALLADRSVVAYCVHGHEVSQSVASALQKSGFRPPISKAASRIGRSASCRRAASAAPSKTNG